MKPGTMYGNTLGRFTLVGIAIAGDGEHLNVWDVADVETGAVRQLDEDEIFAADEVPAQVGQAWIDDDCLVTLTSCRRKDGAWVWDVIDSDLLALSDDGGREISEGALLAYYARVDGLEPETMSTERKDART